MPKKMITIDNEFDFQPNNANDAGPAVVGVVCLILGIVLGLVALFR